MKKIIVATILGVTAAANSFGQGSIIFDNYTQGTYNQIVWGVGVPGKTAGTAVDDALTLQLYFAQGTGFTTLSQLTPGVTGVIDLSRTYVGPSGTAGGYFSGATQLLPTWAPGATFTFAVVVTGPGAFTGISPFWTESSAIHSTVGPQSGFLNFPAGTIVTVPEPTTFALVGLGSAAMLILRRRRA